jgi:hypothetical protein
MSLSSFVCAIVVGVCVSGTAHADSAPCVTESGASRNVLLELYTSEGCDSCPPADRRMTKLKQQTELVGRLVPLAFHVDYWDRLGWKDRFASPRYTQRQWAMAGLARSRLVYTPQFLRNGRDWRSTSGPLEGMIPSDTGVRIVLALDVAADNGLVVSGEVSGVSGSADTYLAAYQNNLETAVRAGENAGKVLRHDFVVRRLLGPLSPDPAGRVALRQQITPDTDWKPEDIGVAVFVQDSASGEILQAAQRAVCPSQGSSTP